MNELLMSILLTSFIGLIVVLAKMFSHLDKANRFLSENKAHFGSYMPKEKVFLATAKYYIYIPIFLILAVVLGNYLYKKMKKPKRSNATKPK